MGYGSWSRHDRLWPARNASNESGPDLQADEQPASRSVVAQPHPAGSIVRYLSIEVDNALEISEQIEIWRT